MKSIWFFVGLMLTVIGVIIFLTGIYYWLMPAHTQTVLEHLYPDIWWGAIMAIVGAIFLYNSLKWQKSKKSA